MNGHPRGPILGARSKLEKVVGRELPAVFWESPGFCLWGPRVLVARVEPIRKVGSIEIPDRYQTPLSEGWVLAAGPQVDFQTEYGGCPYPPEDLIGRKVLFGKYSGQALKVGDLGEDDFTSLYTIMPAAEIWLDYGPPPFDCLEDQ